MQYDVQTPQEYMQMLEDDWRREKLEELRAIIKSCAPELTEGIDYKMLCYRDDKEIVFGLNAQKHYVSLYVGDVTKIDPDGSLLAGLNVGKGCIRFTKKQSDFSDRHPRIFGAGSGYVEARRRHRLLIRTRS